MQYCKTINKQLISTITTYLRGAIINNIGWFEKFKNSKWKVLLINLLKFQKYWFHLNNKIIFFIFYTFRLPAVFLNLLLCECVVKLIHYITLTILYTKNWTFLHFIINIQTYLWIDWHWFNNTYRIFVSFENWCIIVNILYFN